MMSCLHLLLLACGAGSKPSTSDSAPTDDGGATTLEDGGRTGTELVDVPTYACPGPPDGAIVFSTGTLQAEQMFYPLRDEGGDRSKEQDDRALGWWLDVYGASFVYEKPCEWSARRYVDQVKTGERPGEYHFELQVSAPARTIEGWPGLHGDGNGHLKRPDMAAARVTIGWYDEEYHWVHSLPHGMTDTTVCIGTLSPDYVYLTVLWEPDPDGPYPGNERNPMDQPIWFDVEMFAYDTNEKEQQRGCLSTGYGTEEIMELPFQGYDWPGRRD